MNYNERLSHRMVGCPVRPSIKPKLKRPAKWPSYLKFNQPTFSELSDLNLTKLLKMLLHLEAKSAGIAERAVDVGLNINVASGIELWTLKTKRKSSL